MKAEVSAKNEVEIATVKITVPVRYEEEDIPNNFPFRKGEVWSASIDIDARKVIGWPTDYGPGKLHMKVCDSGVYTLYDRGGKELACIDQNYVPHGLIPGEWGDYIELDIAADGTVNNWPKHPAVNEFFGDNE